MLRASTQINGEDVDLTAVTKGGQVDSGVEAGGVLVAFAEAAMTGSESDVAAAREALRSRLGDAATVDAPIKPSCTESTTAKQSYPIASARCASATI